MAQDEHRGFARNPRDLPEQEFIGHEIAQQGDSLLGKGFD